MNKSPTNIQINPTYEDDDKPPSFLHLKEIANQTVEFDHSSYEDCNRYEVLKTGKAKPAQGSNRALFALVIIVCLISFLALLLTLLMLVGKIGFSNEGSYLAKIKALEENITSLQLGLDANKPSAHIEGAHQKADVTYQANTVIKDWNVSAPSSHLAGGMKYQDGNLTVPTPGRYYLYTQLYYDRSRTGRVVVCVNNNPVTMIQPLTSVTGSGALFAGGVFKLKAGDVISLKTAEKSKFTIYMSSTAHSYFGAFLI